jgi:hypothetical protein
MHTSPEQVQVDDHEVADDGRPYSTSNSINEEDLESLGDDRSYSDDYASCQGENFGEWGDPFAEVEGDDIGEAGSMKGNDDPMDDVRTATADLIAEMKRLMARHKEVSTCVLACR